MATVPTPELFQRSFDDLGRALPLTVDEIRERNDRALAAINALDKVGGDSEQHETLEYLMRFVDDDRMSDRLRFEA
jgi:hypothetical protein